jgi:ketosteroid isomerase-like protein
VTSEDNVRMVRRAYEVAFVERSVESIADAADESFVWHQRTEWPGRSQYSLEELPQLWADLDDTYTELTLVPEDFAPVGEYVLVTVRTSARVGAGGARMERDLYHVWHVRDGKLREVRVYGTREEALEAVAA